jgi:hypothetical protein
LTKTQEARKRDFQGGEAASRDTLFLVQLDVGRIHSWLLAALLKVLLQPAAERASALNRSSQVERSARMTTTAQATDWVKGYVQAWTTNTETDVSAIFTDDAVYYERPTAEPWRGREEIVREWLARKDYQVDWTFDWSVLLVSDTAAVIEGTAVYGKGAAAQTFCNLWVVELDADGRCSSFREWLDIPG